MINISDFNRQDTLKNGLAVTIRAMRPDDREKVAAAIRELDRDSLYFRLFTYRSEFTAKELDRILSVDPAREAALLVTVGAGADEIVIGSGRYVASAAGGAGRTAEVAFIVEEDYHGLGIAGRLLAHLIDCARQQGIVALEADVLSENRAMLSVFARSGLPMQQRRDGGVMHVTLSLNAPPA
jgi:GNAT superfamily N-acetyltransferase